MKLSLGKPLVRLQHGTSMTTTNTQRPPPDCLRQLDFSNLFSLTCSLRYDVSNTYAQNAAYKANVQANASKSPVSASAL